MPNVFISSLCFVNHMCIGLCLPPNAILRKRNSNCYCNYVHSVQAIRKFVILSFQNLLSPSLFRQASMFCLFIRIFFSCLTNRRGSDIVRYGKKCCKYVIRMDKKFLCELSSGSFCGQLTHQFVF